MNLQKNVSPPSICHLEAHFGVPIRIRPFFQSFGIWVFFEGPQKNPQKTPKKTLKKKPKSIKFGWIWRVPNPKTPKKTLKS